MALARGLRAGLLVGRHGGLALALVAASLAVGARRPRHHDALLPLAQAGRLADAVAQVIQLGPADPAGALHLDARDARRVQRENALDALALHDAPHRERGAPALAALRDHHAGVDLHALLLPFEDAQVHVHGVADLEVIQVAS